LGLGLRAYGARSDHARARARPQAKLRAPPSAPYRRPAAAAIPAPVPRLSCLAMQLFPISPGETSRLSSPRQVGGPPYPPQDILETTALQNKKPWNGGGGGGGSSGAAAGGRGRGTERGLRAGAGRGTVTFHSARPNIVLYVCGKVLV
jgi:hypothetical protein